MNTYGYARVSTSGQELDIQRRQLTDVGCTRIFSEKDSGLNDDRRQLSRMLKILKPGDAVVVPAFDRLTRSGPFVTLCILREITLHGAVCRSLAEPYVDATTPIGEVFAALVGFQGRKSWDDLIFRTRAGRERARARGVKFGRKPKLSAEQRRDALRRREAGDSLKLLAKSYEVSCSTISRLAARK